MTTGFIYAALFYVVSLILAALIGFALFPGDILRALDLFGVVARILGPTIVAPLGFILGFFREQRRLRREREQAEEMERERMRQTTAIRLRQKKSVPASAPATATPPAQPQPEEVVSGDATTPEVESSSPGTEAELESAGAGASTEPAQTGSVRRSEMSEEVREFLKQTSRVDLKGIKDFIEETRKHRVEDEEENPENAEKNPG